MLCKELVVLGYVGEDIPYESAQSGDIDVPRYFELVRDRRGEESQRSVRVWEDLNLGGHGLPVEGGRLRRTGTNTSSPSLGINSNSEFVS